MKNVYKILLVGIVLVGCGSSNEESITNIVETDAVETVKQGVSVIGTVQATKIKDVYIDFPVIVEDVWVKEGDIIEKGNNILSINYEGYKENIVRKEKSIENLKLQLNKIKKEIDPAVVEITQIQDELSTKQKGLKNDTDAEIIILKDKITAIENDISVQEKEYLAQKDIYDAGGITQHELEELQQQIKKLEENKKEAEDNLNKVKSEKEMELKTLEYSLELKQLEMNNTQSNNQTEVQRLNKEIQIAQSELNEMKSKLVRNDLENGVIIADESYLIYALTPHVGSKLTGEEEEPIFSVVEKDNLVVTVNIPESFIKDIQLGSKAEISFYMDNNNTVSGKVVRIANNAIIVDGETIVQADIDVDDHNTLKLGYQAEVKIY